MYFLNPYGRVGFHIFNLKSIMIQQHWRFKSTGPYVDYIYFSGFILMLLNQVLKKEKMADWIHMWKERCMLYMQLQMNEYKHWICNAFTVQQIYTQYKSKTMFAHRKLGFFVLVWKPSLRIAVKLKSYNYFRFNF